MGRKIIRPDLEGGCTVGGVEVINASGQVVADLKDTLASGKIYVGNSSNVATEVTPTGDVTITNAGATAIGAGKVTLAMLATIVKPSHVVKFLVLGSTVTSTTLTGLAVGDIVVRCEAAGTVVVKPCATINTLPDDPADTDYIIVFRATA
jgi:archaellum component FlaF (FlaF/FlaG flagellin family)